MLLYTIIYTAVYMYIQPYKDQGANILQTIMQVDILLMLAISSTDQFKVCNYVVNSKQQQQLEVFIILQTV